MSVLPSETWIDIFERCNSYDRYSIMLVCWAWHDLALRTPQLWTNIVFDHPDHFVGPGFWYREQQIVRSGSRPLDVILRLPYFYPNPNDSETRTKATESDFIDPYTSFEPHLFAVTDLLRPHVHRFRALIINTAKFWPSPIISLGEGQKTPLLESLSIATCSDFVDWNAKPLIPLFDFEHYFTHASHLTFLELPSYALPVPLPNPTYLPSVDTLYLNCYEDTASGVKEVIAFVQSLSSSLRHLNFVSVDDDSWEATASLDFPIVLSLPNLSTINFTIPGSGFDLLQCLHAPNLECAYLDGWRSEEYEGIWEGRNPQAFAPTFHRFSQRQPGLKCLRLYCYDVDMGAEFWHWLLCDAFPTLEMLSLDQVPIKDDAFDCGACPSLKTLHIRTCKNLSRERMLQFCETRDKDFDLSFEE